LGGKRGTGGREAESVEVPSAKCAEPRRQRRQGSAEWEGVLPSPIDWEA